MASISQNTSVSAGGVSVSGTNTRTVTGQIGHDPKPKAGVAGELSTRTDNNTGAVTFANGSHGFVENQIVDVYWDGGMRYGMVCGAPVVEVVPIDGGAGDNLPSATTDLVVSERLEVDTDFVGNKMVLMALGSNKRSSIDFLDSMDASLLQVEIAANESEEWRSNSMHANPLAGDTVARAFVSSGETAQAQMNVVIGYNSSV